MFGRPKLMLFNKVPPEGGGGTPPAGGSLIAGTPPAGTPPPTPPLGEAPPPGEKTWRDSLPEGIRDNADLVRYKSVEELGNAYINLRKHQSGEKLVIPGKNADDEEWRQVFQKLGLPEKPEDYGLKADDAMDQELLKAMSAKFHEAGVLPKQAQALVAWMHEHGKQAEAQQVEALRKQVDANVEALKKEWGQAFDRNVAASRKVVQTFVKDIPELAQVVEDPALGTNPAFIKFLAKVSETLWKEDAFKGGDVPAGAAYTPAEARKKANMIMGDQTHPYWKKEHPGHKEAVREVQELLAASNETKG